VVWPGHYAPLCRVSFHSTADARAGSESRDIALHLLSHNDALEDGAVFDAWALGRHYARYHLLILRRLLLDLRPRALLRAICLLSYCGSHPDVFWTPDNRIPPDIETRRAAVVSLVPAGSRL